MEITKDGTTYIIVDDAEFQHGCDVCVMGSENRCNEKRILGRHYPYCYDQNSHWEIKPEDKQ